MDTHKERIRTLRPTGTPALLHKRRRWFDGEGDEVTDTDTAPDKGGTSGGTQQAATLSQDEANRLIGEARKKGRETALADLLKEFGVDKADDLKALVADAKARAEADMTEADKAKAAKDAAEKKLAEREAELDRERQERRLEKRDGAIKAALGKAGARDAEKVLAVLAALKRADVEATLKADGAVDEAKLTKLVEDAKKAYAEDFGGGRFNPGSPSNAGGRASEPDKDAKARASRLNQQRIRG